MRRNTNQKKGDTNMECSLIVFTPRAFPHALEYFLCFACANANCYIILTLMTGCICFIQCFILEVFALEGLYHNVLTEAILHRNHNVYKHHNACLLRTCLQSFIFFNFIPHLMIEIERESTVISIVLPYILITIFYMAPMVSVHALPHKLLHGRAHVKSCWGNIVLLSSFFG